MEIIKEKDLAKAIAVIKRGGVIVYPTDTAYGLGGFFDSLAVKNRILKIKGRKDDKFTLIAADRNQVAEFFKLNSVQLMLAKKYWPGPLSLVVSKKYAVRVPDNKIARKLAKVAGRPLIATSANISGGQTLYDSQSVIEEFAGRKNQPDLIIDAGRLKKIKTSTIVAVADEKIEIIRPGAVTVRS